VSAAAIPRHRAAPFQMHVPTGCTCTHPQVHVRATRIKNVQAVPGACLVFDDDASKASSSKSAQGALDVDRVAIPGVGIADDRQRARGLMHVPACTTQVKCFAREHNVSTGARCCARQNLPSVYHSDTAGH